MTPGTDSPDIGFVLLHGSELGGWIWERVIPLLERPSVAVDLPGRGSRPALRSAVTLDDAVRAVAEDTEICDSRRVVLVAHSFSGVLLPPVIHRLGGKVAAAVFVGASVPREDRGWVDLLPAPQRILLRMMYRFRPNGMLSPASQNRTALCNDLDDETTEAVLERRVPEAPRILLDRISPTDLPTSIPSHHVRLTEDRTATIGAQNATIARLPDARVHDLASGHLPMFSKPQELATILNSVAEETSRPTA